MITLQQAIELATEAHKNQWRNPTTIKTNSLKQHKQNPDLLDKNGNKIIWCNDNIFLVYAPYIAHPLAVMDMMSTNEEKIVAVLHDVVEDTELTLADLRNAGVPSKLIHVINKLTKYKDNSYEQYISGIITSKLATKVKLADIFHNLSDNPSEHAKQKYIKAMHILLQNI